MSDLKQKLVRSFRVHATFPAALLVTILLATVAEKVACEGFGKCGYILSDPDLNSHKTPTLQGGEPQ